MARTFPKIEERLLGNMQPVTESGCWIFTGCTTLDGYGRIRYKGETKLAHVVSYEIFKGTVPDNLMVMHSCDVRCCINPDHLGIGSHNDNMKDMTSKGRQAVMYGSDNSNCKLSDDAVDEIVSRYTLEKISQKTLAAEYGVSQQLISGIITGKFRTKRG